MKKKTQYLVELDVDDKFIINAQDVTGTLLKKSEFGCLVVLDNSRAFDNEGNETRKKEKVRIAAETEVRRLNVRA